MVNIYSLALGRVIKACLTKALTRAHRAFKWLCLGIVQPFKKQGPLGPIFSSIDVTSINEASY